MKRRKIAKLIIEPHPKKYNGPEWLTLVEYAHQTQLVVVDALDKTHVWGYNFDALTNIEQAVFTEFMNEYWEMVLYNEPLRKRVPVHEWLYDKNLGEFFGHKLVGYNVNDIMRLVGYVRKADGLGEKMHMKRRKRILIKL